MRVHYQKGSVVEVNKRAPMWAGKYTEMELQPDGSLKRVFKTVRLGPKKELTKPQAQRLLDKITRPLNAESYRPKQKDQTIRAAYEKWMKLSLPNYKPSGAASMTSCLRKVKDEFGHLDCAAIKSDRVQDWVNRLAASGLARRTIQNYLMAFKMFWADLQGWEYVSTWPFRRVKLPKGSKPEQPHFTLDQTREILQRTENEPYRTMLAILAETGMRGGELCGLFTSDVDLDARTISIARSAYQGHLQDPKNFNASRTLHISGHLAERIRAYTDSVRLTLIGANGGSLAALAKAYSPEQKLLFPYYKSPTGLAWDNADIVAEGLNPVLEQMGIKKFRMGLHAFRHMNRTLMHEMGVSEIYACKRVGHSTGNRLADSGQAVTPMGKNYIHARDENHKLVAEMIGRALFDPKKPVRSETEQMALAMGAD